MDIGRGDWVEYVGSGPDVPDYVKIKGSAPEKGSIWRVADCGKYCGLAWVLCEGQAHPGEIDPLWRHVPGWDARAYRPIYRPRNSTLIADLTKTPVRVEA